MKQFSQQLKWQFLLLARNNVIVISLIVSAIYAGIFYAFRNADAAEQILTVIILNDPAIIGMIFIGLGIIMERNQQVLQALFVTPINHHVYLLSRIISLSLVGWLCGLLIAVAAIGTDLNWLHFSAGVFGLSVLSCLAGIYMVIHTDEFMKFLLKTIPVVLVFVNLPLLNYFGITDWRLFDYLPSQGCIDLLTNAYGESPDGTLIIRAYVVTTLWIVVLYFLVYDRFMKKMVAN